MASNRFALLTEEDSAESVDIPNNASLADTFDPSTLSAALKYARQVPLPIIATQARVLMCCYMLPMTSVAVQHQTGTRSRNEESSSVKGQAK